MSKVSKWTEDLKQKVFHRALYIHAARHRSSPHLADGGWLGLDEGALLGDIVGEDVVGLLLGDEVGAIDGDALGLELGSTVGGAVVGLTVGIKVGASVGLCVGAGVGG